jgi:hypothetical protein
MNQSWRYEPGKKLLMKKTFNNLPSQAPGKFLASCNDGSILGNNKLKSLRNCDIGNIPSPATNALFHIPTNESA